MKYRRWVAALLATLISVGLVSIASPAQAAGTCSLIVPTRVSVGSPYQAVAARLWANCAANNYDWAAWEAYHPTTGYEGSVIFETPQTTDYWDLYATYVPLGRYQWHPAGAYAGPDGGYESLYQYTYYTDVRLASWGKVTAARSGTKVTLQSTIYRYYSNTYDPRYIRWAGARGQIQYWNGTAWQGLKEVYSNSYGVYTWSYYTGTYRAYRLVTYSTSQIWNHTSATVRA